MNIQVRRRLRRELAAQEEGEQGELNLVAYLDIVVNAVIFLLATTITVLPLSAIHASAPREVVDGPAAGASLTLTVAISNSGLIVAGAGGVMRHADGTLPTLKCVGPLQGGQCRSYDLGGLTELARRIKAQHPRERKVIVIADPEVTYQAVVQVMDALRGDCGRAATCLFDQVQLGTGVE